MDYNKAKEKVNALKKELFDTYVETLKNVLKEKGKKASMFSDTLSIDVSACEIDYNHPSTLDEVYYIPGTDELGFIIWDNEMHTKTYVCRTFRQNGYSDFEILTHLFYYLVDVQDFGN